MQFCRKCCASAEISEILLIDSIFIKFPATPLFYFSIICIYYRNSVPKLAPSPGEIFSKLGSVSLIGFNIGSFIIYGLSSVCSLCNHKKMIQQSTIIFSTLLLKSFRKSYLARLYKITILQRMRWVKNIIKRIKYWLNQILVIAIQWW